jgi:ActR/RegA family two-component response regulator
MIDVPHSLLIDDEPAFAQSLKSLLAGRGLPLDVANSWDDGLNQFRVSLHELVIADYNLPNSRNGLKLLLEIKRLHPASRLILISGVLDAAAEAAIARTPLVNRYLTKTGASMSGVLAQEVADAAQRAQIGTDWLALGQNHIERVQIDERVLDEIDAALSVNLPR